MSIAILCPTRGRPEQCNRMIDSVDGKATLFIGGHDLRGYKSGINIGFFPMEENLPTAQKWNDLAKIAILDTRAKLFMLGSDDMYFVLPGWDEALINHYNALENKIHVYALQDSRDVEGTPHIIVTREYIEAMGYFVPPIFLHWFIDTWTVQIAKANNCFTHMKDFILVHDKPSDRGLIDETHSRIRQWGWKQRDQFVNDTMQHVLEYEKKRLGKCVSG